MRSDDGGLATYREVAVVLGGGLTPDGRANAMTLARADAAARLAAERDVAIIVSGSHGNGPVPSRTEAAYMAERLERDGVATARVFIEDASRDTLSNAAFVADRYLVSLTPRPLVIVTSAFHMPRALATFALVLGAAWPLEAHPVADGVGGPDVAERERQYLERTRALLGGLAPGDVRAIAERVRATLGQRVRDG